uniref:Uncharacterized protein n=1 Tax=Tanacetum cinerariifolium TaxID=118510 RepID=A0A6L2KST9_TANCI|nr:hypothetical protein [Tanacetum cinerariifolium]
MKTNKRCHPHIFFERLMRIKHYRYMHYKEKENMEFSSATFVAGEESLNDKNGSYVAPILVDFLVKEFRPFPQRHVAGDNVIKV